MSNRTTPKMMKMGYELKINRTGEKGAKNWQRVGWLFGSSQAASNYRKLHHPEVTKYVIMGVRVAAFPKPAERFQFLQPKPEQKAVK